MLIFHGVYFFNPSKGKQKEIDRALACYPYHVRVKGDVLADLLVIHAYIQFFGETQIIRLNPMPVFFIGWKI